MTQCHMCKKESKDADCNDNLGPWSCPTEGRLSWPLSEASTFKSNTTEPLQPSSTSVSNRTSVEPPTLAFMPYEILEAILLNLPPQHLLLVQRVSRIFREISSSSKRIQRALFLEPMHYSGELSTWQLLRWNPFLETRLSRLLNVRVIGVHRGSEGSVKMVAHVRFEKQYLADSDRHDIDVLLRDEASWKKMLVTQPPATLLMHPSASLFWKSSSEHQAQFFHDPAGFTIMDLVSCVNW
ncbi:hypothetical protein K505DRAFT_35324 [Melanomma pulvis-pyrius CBS 109.77]|uniref:F-box domain-containing protein n=1 Tax=Melanomma pulvis-pyrius CBS 109.77 TaxID=1314802 RepID=A0A6A6XBH9_9PLEO|nr:hypothetical protein K505DRAFT_35324 [Melanomma pulvis-pyrius CBS 109.77]